MAKKAERLILIPVLSVLGISSCGGHQAPPPIIETRPLEKGKAQAIIEEVLTESGYGFEKDARVMVTRGTEFGVDYKIEGEPVAIEYLSQKERQAIGELPPPGEGSRLHVLNGQLMTGVDGVISKVFVLFIDDRNFIYHANPTSEVRADVTFLEVDSRLRRDVSDFIGWYENSGKR